MTLQAVVVGLGRIGAGFQRDPLRVGAVTHAGGYRDHPATDLAGGVDPDPSQRAAFEDDFGVPAFETLDALLEVVQPDLVSVATPPPTHAAVVRAALAAGAARVICEKPVTPDLAAAVELAGSLGEDSWRVGVNYSRRYDPLHELLLGIARDDGVIGGRGRYTAGIRNTASHWLDGLRHAGAEVAEVLAVPAVEAPDPSPTLLLRLVGGATVYLEGGSVDDFLSYETDLLTREHRVQLLDSGSRGVLFERRASDRFSGYHELLPADLELPPGMVGPMLPVVADAARSVAEDRPMRCTIHDAVAVHRIIEAADRSLRSAGWEAVVG